MLCESLLISSFYYVWSLSVAYIPTQRSQFIANKSSVYLPSDHSRIATSLDPVKETPLVANKGSAVESIKISAAGQPSAQESTPYSDRVSVTSRSPVAQLPNPCTDGQFRAPVYELDNLGIFKDFYNDNDNNPNNFFTIVNFTLRDVANNYSFRCNWGPRNPAAGPSWEIHDCEPESGPIIGPSQSLTLLNLWPEFLMLNKSRDDPIRIVQYWYCDIVNGSYP
jgi:hypothetical protein